MMSTLNIDHPVLNKLPQEIKDAIEKVAEKRVVPTGKMVFHQGDPGDRFFLIKSGSLRVFRRSEDNIETELSVLGPGDSFGEMALLTGAPRSASVEAISDALLITLSKEQFDNILKDYPEVTLALIKQMSTWLVENDLMLEQKVSIQFRQPKMSIFDFVFILCISCFFAIVFNHSNPNGIKLFPEIKLNRMVETITPEKAMQELEEDQTYFIDALPPTFFNDEHIPGSINLPLSVFDIMYLMNLSDADKAKKIIVYGRTISRLYDIELANKLFLQGHKNIRILRGGLSAWEKKGYPVEP